MKLSRESGIPIKIRMCDTMGFGVNYPGTSLPRSVQGIVYGLHHHAEVPSELLEWHGHNDFYKVVTNATTAWLYGASCGQLLAARHRRAHGQLPARSDGDRIRLPARHRRRHGLYRHHRHRALFRGRTRLHHPAQHPFRRALVQRDPRGHPCGRNAQRPRDLQHLRYRQDPRPPRARLHQQRERPRGHRVLDQRLLLLPEEHRIDKQDSSSCR